MGEHGEDKVTLMWPPWSIVIWTKHCLLLEAVVRLSEANTWCGVGVGWVGGGYQVGLDYLPCPDPSLPSSGCSGYYRWWQGPGDAWAWTSEPGDNPAPSPSSPSTQVRQFISSSCHHMISTTQRVSIFLCARFEGSSPKADQFPEKGTIQADHRFNCYEFKITTLYNCFMTGSFPKLIYLKEKQIIPSHDITENMSQSQMLRAIKRILSPKCLHTIYNYIFPLRGNQPHTASIFLLFFSFIFVFTA